jgi:hypothetical protein
MNWHAKTMNRFKTLATESLLYIRIDAYQAAKAGDGWNPKAGQYWDEFHYACMELKKRGVNTINLSLQSKGA